MGKMFGRVGSLLRRPRVLAAGALIYVSGSVLALIALRRGDNEPDSNGLVDMESAQDAHRCCERRFDSLARSYDEKIDRDEQSNGILVGDVSLLSFACLFLCVFLRLRPSPPPLLLFLDFDTLSLSFFSRIGSISISIDSVFLAFSFRIFAENYALMLKEMYSKWLGGRDEISSF